MSTYSNCLQPALQNLLRVVRFFHPRSSCMTTRISADIQKVTLNASCMTISGGRTKQLDIFCITGFMSDFLSFIVVELIQFFHGALQLYTQTNKQLLPEQNKLETELWNSWLNWVIIQTNTEIKADPIFLTLCHSVLCHINWLTDLTHWCLILIEVSCKKDIKTVDATLHSVCMCVKNYQLILTGKLFNSYT